MDKNKIEIQNINEVIIDFIRYNSDIKQSFNKYSMYDNIIHIEDLLFSRDLIHSILQKLSTKENKHRELIILIDLSNECILDSASYLIRSNRLNIYKDNDIFDIKEFATRFIYDKLITILKASDFNFCNILILYPSDSYMEFIRYTTSGNDISVSRKRIS